MVRWMVFLVCRTGAEVAYRIKTVAEMLGVPRNTLIAWERRLGVGEPNRSESGYRLYSEGDVALLRRVKGLVDQGLRIGEAWSIIQEERVRGDAAAPAPGVRDGLLEEVLAALLRFDRQAADEAASRLLMVPVERQLDDVIFPMLFDVGQGWAAGEITIAQEHFVSGWCRERLMLLMNTIPAPPRGAPEITCATPAGENHELGLLGVSIRLALRRFRVTWLGANVPANELVEHARVRLPFGVCLSLVQERSVTDLANFARDLRRRLPPGTRLAIGGRGSMAAELPMIPGVTWCGDSLPDWADEPGARSNAIG
jgi:DNA-binding transcriptional MerR regulator